MTSDFELAFRQLLKTIVREVAVELLKDRQAPERPQLTQPVRTDDGLLITTREAAKRMSISDRHLHSLTQSGVLPCVRIGKSVRYSVETIQKWIRESEGKDLPQVKKIIAIKERAASAEASKVKPTPVPRLSGNKSLPANPPNQMRTTATSKQRKSTKTESEASKSPFSHLLDEIGVKRDSLPPLSNGELMRIAGVDLVTFHGWMYLHRKMPEAALGKLREHFSAYRKGNGNANDSEASPQ